MLNFDDMTTEELWNALPESEGLEKGRLLMNLMGRKEQDHEHETAITLVQQAEEVFLQHGFSRDFALAKAYEGDAQINLGNLEAALTCYKEALDFLDKITDSSTIAQVHLSMGDAHSKNHQHQNAIGEYTIAVSIFEDEEDLESAAKAQYSIVRLLLADHRNDEVLPAAIKSYDLAKAAQSSHGTMLSLQHLGHAQQRLELHEDAKYSALSALAIARLCECRSCLPDALLDLGVIYYRAEEYEPSLRHLKKSVKLFKKAGMHKMELMSLACLGRTLLAMDDPKAEEVLLNVMYSTDHIDIFRARLVAGLAMSDLEFTNDNRAGAINYLDLLLPEAIRTGAHRAETQISLKLCPLLLEEGQTSRVKSILQRIEPIFIGPGKDRITFESLQQQLLEAN